MSYVYAIASFVADCCSYVCCLLAVFLCLCARPRSRCGRPGRPQAAGNGSLLA